MCIYIYIYIDRYTSPRRLQGAQGGARGAQGEDGEGARQNADGHTASNAPDLFRPPKLSGAGPG